MVHAKSSAPVLLLLLERCATIIVAASSEMLAVAGSIAWATPQMGCSHGGQKRSKRRWWKGRRKR
jgi:hypothetical protein